MILKLRLTDYYKNSYLKKLVTKSYTTKEGWSRSVRPRERSADPVQGLGGRPSVCKIPASSEKMQMELGKKREFKTEFGEKMI